MSPDPDVEAEFREIRSILRESITATNSNSIQISALTQLMIQQEKQAAERTKAAVSNVQEFVSTVLSKTNQKMVWFLVGAVILASLGTKGLEILAKLFGVG